MDVRGRRARWHVAFVALGSAIVSAIAIHATAGVAPSGCTSLEDMPVNNTIEFAAGIQANIFVHFSDDQNFGCADCHTTAGGTVSASGNLNLDPSETSPYSNLVNVPSSEDSSMAYVVPNHPERSLLFLKVNCDNPGVDARMPLDNYGGGLSVDKQALIYDWIAQGAPIGPTNGIFRGTFDIRGLFADHVFASGFEGP